MEGVLPGGVVGGGKVSLLDSQDIMKTAYSKFPRKDHYDNTALDEKHSCWKDSRVIYCDGSRDILRCNSCGREWETRCNFDDEYN